MATPAAIPNAGTTIAALNLLPCELVEVKGQFVVQLPFESVPAEE